ncbi:MAG: class I SAM-dependent methyltransferase [Chloroflexi bacterium]|nr:class I SAM-dependent methyltransferase [Chloroflexota bacterium]
MDRDYLTELLNIYWFAPPVALWRAVELRVASEESYPRPLLDLGCGDGLIASGLFSRDQPVEVGIDPWWEQVQQAARSGMYRHVDLGDGARLPYVSRYFASAFSNSVLEHIPDIEPVLCEVGRILRPGGTFGFTVPSDAFRYLLDGYRTAMESGRSAEADAYANRIDRTLAHYHYHTPDEWRGLLGAAGFRMIKARYYMPEAAVRLWDRMNGHYGIGRPKSLWGLLASPRLRGLGYQSLLKWSIVRLLSRDWRAYYEMDVGPGDTGGGLLIVACREEI